MLVAIALDKPLADVKELVEDHTRLIAEIMQILQDKQAHPVLAQMVNPDVRDDLQSPNLLQPPQPAAAAAREKEPNLMSHTTDFSELTLKTNWILPTWETHDWPYPSTCSPLLTTTKCFPCKSQPTWETHGWID